MPSSPLDLTNFSSLLTEEERMLQEAMSDFATQTLKPHIQDWFDSATLPAKELGPQFGQLGALGMHLEGYGCPGASAVAYGLACMEIEAVDSGLRSFVSVQGSLAMFAIHHWGSDEQKEKYLPKMAAGEYLGCFGLTEPDAGSDPASMKTRAVKDGDEWILNGTKMWITNSPVADVAVVWARTEDGYAGFILEPDMEGFSAPEIHKKLSLRASITGEIVLDNCRVPDSHRLPKVNSLRGPLTCLNEARYGIIWGALGAARDCLVTTIDYTQTREVFGKSLSNFQLTQAKLANMAVELNKSTLLALQLGRLKDKGELAPHQVSVGKLNSTRIALDIARECRTLLGASGITLEYSPLRHANNLESVLTYEGTAEMHQLIIGQALTGTSAFR
ncbi:acyl-CoA dehydrogenase family protein [Corynebacterium anserum]|uniref:glutaryl-CoA dehydrogenase (ETF) n=1 Tax=Corynebacterium anserum TaxID=2684406 RepID=A0A7G7YLT3_9CORY|nr:acyl-CoA dehydrogenase family protein [Corynebacterium anserum]MBC2681382.1 acyl-CoA dehydrogenase [Corynebacterium anserum]QNH95453.1 acyl-CoA dehydrogenase [Corynebacterium anserum]